MSQINRWQLKDDVKEKWTPVIQEHIKKIEDHYKNGDNPYNCFLNLTGTELNPYTLWKILEELGYEREDQEDNGWELDFWIYFTKQDARTLLIRGTGILCEFFLSGDDEQAKD